MVERGLDADLGVVQRPGINLYFRVPRAPAEEIDSSTLAHHLQRPLPRGRLSNRFNHRVCSASALGQLAHKGNRIVYLGDIVRGDGTQALGGAHLTITFADGDHADVASGKNADEFQPNRPAANDDYGVAI